MSIFDNEEEEFWQEDLEVLPELTEDIPDIKFKAHFNSRVKKNVVE